MTQLDPPALPEDEPWLPPWPQDLVDRAAPLFKTPLPPGLATPQAEQRRAAIREWVRTRFGPDDIRVFLAVCDSLVELVIATLGDIDEFRQHAGLTVCLRDVVLHGFVSDLQHRRGPLDWLEFDASYGDE